MMQKMAARVRRHLKVSAVAALLAAAAATLPGCSYSGTSPGSVPASSATANSGFDGAALPPGTPAPGFALEDQFGRTVSLGEFRGRVVVLAFLYTTCGRVCTLVAEQIRGALDELGKPVPVLVVSADPAADDRASIAAFLARVSLTGRALYLTGSPAHLEPIWRAYDVTPPERNRAGFENTIAVRLINRRGEDRVLFQLEGEDLTVEGLAHDIQKLLAE
jgi:protein SCO1/2